MKTIAPTFTALLLGLDRLAEKESERQRTKGTEAGRERESWVIHHGEVSCPVLPSHRSADRRHHSPHFITAHPTIIESPQGGRGRQGSMRKEDTEIVNMGRVNEK